MLAGLSRAGIVRILAIFALGCAAGYAAAAWGSVPASGIAASFGPIEEKDLSYHFVHPLLAYRTPEAVKIGEYDALDRSLQSAITSAKDAGLVRASVYFRDLPASLWVGVNENDAYYPASLLKVPIMKEGHEKPPAKPAASGLTSA